MPVPRDLVLVINSSTQMVHVGNAAEVQIHVRGPNGNDPVVPGTKFFSVNGRGIRSWDLRTLASHPSPQQMDRIVGTAPEPGVAALVDQIKLAGERVKNFLPAEDQAAAAWDEGMFAGTYPEVLVKLHAAFNLGLLPNRPGNFFHNLWHLATGTH